MSGILVVLEERDGRVSRTSWEALAAGQHLAAQTNQALRAAVIGASTESLAAEAASKAVARIIRVEHPLLAPYTPDGYVVALHQLIQKEGPTQVVFPHTYQVRDYAPASDRCLSAMWSRLPTGPSSLASLCRGVSPAITGPRATAPV
jgi:electron transfer flavoprotein alpha subunit